MDNDLTKDTTRSKYTTQGTRKSSASRQYSADIELYYHGTFRDTLNANIPKDS